mgnify:FL=1
MAHKPVINIFKSLNEAMYFKNSQINTQFVFSGVQLLPNNPIKYIQVTETPNGINLEDWIVKVYSLCGKELGDITNNFMVESLTNSTNGNPQLYWSLQNINQDFGWQLVYLKITQVLGETFYTQPFRLTSIESEKTTQINYKFKESDEIQSLGFNLWYDDEDLLQELTTYYEESTKSWVSAGMEQGYIEMWKTELMHKSVLLKLKEIMGLPYVYINGIRASLKEASETPKKVAQENFSEMTFVLNFHPNDVFVQLNDSGGDFLEADFNDNDFLIYN